MRLMILLLTVASAGLPGALGAQPVVDLQYQVEAARKLMEKERRLVIASELVLTESERGPFWDLYNKYAAEIDTIASERVRLIADYARQYDSMSDEFAQRMVTDYLDQESRYLKVRQKYVRRFGKILPPVKLARFYQVENKLDAIYDFNLAAQIPLIGDGSPAR